VPKQTLKTPPVKPKQQQKQRAGPDVAGDRLAEKSFDLGHSIFTPPQSTARHSLASPAAATKDGRKTVVGFCSVS